MSELTDWKKTTLGKHCVICTGKKDVNEGEKFGIYPFFTCSRNHIYSNKFSFDTEALLIAGNGEVGNVEYYKGKFEAYQRTYVLDKFDINIQYIYHLLKYSIKDTLS
ncbi:MAG: restriction endonuclease subunit S, partial [Pseudomonadales bacterium]|nr:restriction endonuclease subunit S [Pseudomonadales bacterium]